MRKFYFSLLSAVAVSYVAAVLFFLAFLRACA